MKRSLAVFLILVISFQISYSNLLKTTNYNEVQFNKNLKTETINEIADPFIENNSKDIIIKETNSAPYNRQELDLIKKIEELNQQLHAAHAGNPSDSQSYTTAQVKDAFLLVRTAATSLNHDQDVMVAKQLLQLAADHLANLKGEKIDLAKAALASDLARLNEVNVVDIAAIQEKLTILDKLINVLPAISSSADPMITPAKTKAKNNTPAKQTWYGSVTNVFSELKSVVKIRKKTDRDLSVADVDLARAQFKLIIEQLR